MASIRKLQQEIQQNLKKVDEGIEIFDEIWEKVYAAEQQSLKEKYEADLKKEIKKLQRLRDQIKVWIGNNDIKDKTQLIDARKTIESKMEMFKVCERDTKTKAYSKEGLAREAKLDPKDQLKEEKRTWVNECLDSLNDLVNSVDLEREKLLNAKGKVKDKVQMERVENRLQKHKWHIARLELIIKLMDNDDLDPTALEAIQDSVDYYIESAADDDGAIGVEDEFDIYEELELDTLGAGSFDIPKPAHSTKDDDKGDNNIDESGNAGKRGKSSAKESVKTVTSNIGKGGSKSTTASPASSKGATSKLSKAGKESTEESTKSSTTEGSDQPIAGPVSNSGTGTSASGPSTTMSWATAAGTQSTSSDPNSSIAGNGSATADAKSSLTTAVMSPGSGNLIESEASADAVQSSTESGPTDTKSSHSKEDSASQKEVENVIIDAIQDSSSPSATGLQSSPERVTVTDLSTDGATGNFPVVPETRTQPVQSVVTQQQQQQQQTRLAPEAMTALSQLHQSLLHTPESLELDKQSRNYYAHCHPSFPSTASFSAHTEATALFEKLPMDTLFFVFYFQQGTFQQYLAAKQLKKHSWRFHKKYMTWFQRHEEPKIATEEFEEGTYVYFDYESGWCQRIKSEFKFEYAYLEDELGGDM